MFEAKNWFSSGKVQIGANRPKMVKNMLYWSFATILDSPRPLWDIGKPAMFGHFWSQKGLFGSPRAHLFFTFIPWSASGAFIRVRSTCYVKETSPFCQAQNFEASFSCTLHKTIFSACSSSWDLRFVAGTGALTLARGLEPLRPRLFVSVDWGARTRLRRSLVLSIGL